MEKNYIKVSALNNYIKLLLEDSTFLHKVYLKGEISNFKNHSSGHLYFTLKDEESRISAIMFRNKTIDLKFTPEDGKKVLVEGHVSCYPSQGTYQIYIDFMEEDGLGNLYVLYEELKNKLEKEGLFATSHKKALPKYPKRIGIVTAPTGAAIKDILSTLKRRYPICETILFPTLVQGKSAAPHIAKQIIKAQEFDIDLLIVGRGGGSIEDLWAFNEEIVARSIYDSKIPVISAVGHEIDYTISDFVADLRAPTPTGAAEMAVPSIQEVKTILLNYQSQLNHIIKQKIDFYTHRLNQVKNAYILKNPNTLYEIKIQKLDYLTNQLNDQMKRLITEKKSKLNQFQNSYILKNPWELLKGKHDNVNKQKERLIIQIRNIMNKKEHQLEIMINTLKLVNPLNILEKGYSLVSKNEKIITSSSEVQKNDLISIKLKDGSMIASVKEVK